MFRRTSQSGLHSALVATGAPEEVQLLVRSLYAQAVAKHMTEAGLVDLFTRRSGVAQGCLGSGWLVAVAFDAYLRLLSASMGEEGLVRKCADDAARVTEVLEVIDGVAVFTVRQVGRQGARMRKILAETAPLLSQVAVVPSRNISSDLGSACKRGRRHGMRPWQSGQRGGSHRRMRQAARPCIPCRVSSRNTSSTLRGVA